ncbi:alpha/beta fold hydrolase [Synechococcus elongatus]|uniref:alpha/beta fold hydrolase n=1 Tax=Synechococcus elongatus TaxID=32046 RepID=UPI001863B712|nr:alpha/beta fold hydrolase [Synechococcus elongatus]
MLKAVWLQQNRGELVAIAEQKQTVGSLEWFYREAEPTQADPAKLPVVCLHGLVSQSYGWRQVLPAIADAGFRAIAPDWIGAGFSSQPERREFAYTPEAFVSALEAWRAELGIERLHLVVQGYLGAVGLLWAAQHPDRVERIALFNTPFYAGASVPWKIRQLGLPLAGEMLCQDPLTVDRVLEGGGGYRVEDADLDVYRRPYLSSSAAGRALLATVRQLDQARVSTEIASALAQWSQPILVGWGDRDPWLTWEAAEAAAAKLPSAEFVRFEETGHYPQEDWPEKLCQALLLFLRRADLR